MKIIVTLVRKPMRKSLTFWLKLTDLIGTNMQKSYHIKYYFMFYFLYKVKNDDVIFFNKHTGFRHNKHYCIIYSKKIPNWTKNCANFPCSAGNGTIPQMMGKTLFNLTVSLTTSFLFHSSQPSYSASKVNANLRNLNRRG